MFGKSVRAIAIASLIGAASYVSTPLGTGLLSPAQAQVTVRPEVGNPLNEASALAQKGNYSGALAKVKEAEGVSNKTSSENQAISQMKQYIASRSGNFDSSGGVNSAGDAKAKLNADYRAKRYRDVIADGELLRKYGAYDFNSQLLVAQAHYLSGDYRGAIRVLNGMGDSEQVLSLLMASAHKAGDTDAEQSAAARLVTRGQPKYWTYLLTAAEKTTGLRNDHRLGISRVRFLSGNMRNEADYRFHAEQAIQMGFAQEGLKVVTRGFSTKALSDERARRLLGLAQREAAKNQAGLARTIAQANASPTGDALVKVGENLWGYGRFAQAATLVQKGIAKGVVNKDGANITLGMVLIGKGDTTGAMRALNAVKDAKYKAIARLWSVYARSPSASSMNTLLGGTAAAAKPKAR